MLIMRRLSLLLVASLWAGALQGQGIQQTKGSFQDKFRQLDEVLPQRMFTVTLPEPLVMHIGSRKLTTT